MFSRPDCFVACALVLVSTSLGPTGVRAAPTDAPATLLGPEESPLWTVGGTLWVADAVVPDVGLTVGAGVDAQRLIGGWPVFLAVHIAGGRATSANADWVFDYYQGLLSAGLGIVWRRGVGRIWAELGGGAQLLYEDRERHQARRLGDAGLPAVRGTGWTLGPRGYALVGLGARVVGCWNLDVSGGPAFSRQRINERYRERWGWDTHVGVRCDF